MSIKVFITQSLSFICHTRNCDIASTKTSLSPSYGRTFQQFNATRIQYLTLSVFLRLKMYTSLRKYLRNGLAIRRTLFLDFHTKHVLAASLSSPFTVFCDCGELERKKHNTINWIN